MQLYYFGNSAKPLFGVHHPAQGKERRRECVVLCPPIGTELLRSYRAFRQLATMLSKNGYDVLRFDYYATGDSSGDCLDSSIEQWKEDIKTAIEELADVSGKDQVSLVGLRLGSSLAACVAKEVAISKLILWEPIVDGSAYLEDRIQTDLAFETEIGHEQEQAKCLKNDEPIGIMGFAWSKSFRDEIEKLDMSSFSEVKADRTFLLVREETKSSQELKEVLKQNSGKFGYQHIEHPGEWGEFDDIGSLLLPQETIKAIVACLL